MPAYIHFKCPCGRTLRARLEQAEATVRCWDCRAEVAVPRARTGTRLVRESVDQARDVLRAGTFGLLLLGSAVLATILALPRVSLVLGLGLLGLAGVEYRRIVRLSGLRGSPDTELELEPEYGRVRRWATRARRWAGGLAIALAWVAPFVIRFGLMDALGWRPQLRQPALVGLGLAALAAACWLATPLVVLLTSACDREGPLPARQTRPALRRHPIAVLCALLLVPVGLAALEAAELGLAYQQRWVGTFLYDFFPSMNEDALVFRYPGFPPPHSMATPFRLVFDRYWHGLARGYTMLGAIPASLPWGPHTQLCPGNVEVYPGHYLAVRILSSTLTFACAGALLAIQARWLGLIVSVDPRRAGPAKPEPIPATRAV